MCFRISLAFVPLLATFFLSTSHDWYTHHFSLVREVGLVNERKYVFAQLLLHLDHVGKDPRLVLRQSGVRQGNEEGADEEKREDGCRFLGNDMGNAHLEAVNGLERVDAWHVPVLEAQQQVPVVLVSVPQILSHQHEVGLERSGRATEDSGR